MIIFNDNYLRAHHDIYSTWNLLHFHYTNTLCVLSLVSHGAYWHETLKSIYSIKIIKICNHVLSDYISV